MKKINLEICKSCPYLDVVKPGEKYLFDTNNSNEPYYACNRHRDCTEYKGFPPYLPKDKFEQDYVPRSCEMREEYGIPRERDFPFVPFGRR